MKQNIFADFKRTSRATAIEFMRCTFLRNSFNVLDYNTVSFELSRIEKHSQVTTGKIV